MSTFHLAVILTRFAGFYVLMTYALPSLIQHGLNGWRVWQASQSAMVPSAGMSGSQWLTDLLYPALYVTVGLAMILKATKFGPGDLRRVFPGRVLPALRVQPRGGRAGPVPRMRARRARTGRARVTACRGSRDAGRGTRDGEVVSQLESGTGFQRARMLAQVEDLGHQIQPALPPREAPATLPAHDRGILLPRVGLPPRLTTELGD